MEFTQAIGVLGAFTYLASYFFLQIGKIDGNSWVYAFLNMCAAIFVVVSLTTAFNIGSLIIQVSFISLSLLAIARSIWKSFPMELSNEEDLLAQILLPNLPKRRAMRLLRHGVLRTEMNTILARQGEPLQNLSVLLEGQAKVEKNGKTVAKLKAGQTIGEVTCLEERPATADVETLGVSRVFSIPVKDLKQILAKETDIADSFKDGIQLQLTGKLT